MILLLVKLRLTLVDRLTGDCLDQTIQVIVGRGGNAVSFPATNDCTRLPALTSRVSAWGL